MTEYTTPSKVLAEANLKLDQANNDNQLLVLPRKDVLAIDLSGCLVKKSNFTNTLYAHTKPIEDAFETIKLCQDWFDDIYIVVKTASDNVTKMVEWLDKQNFWLFSGVTSLHCVFCISPEAKAEICKLLGVTHMIDDTIDILNKAKTVKYRYLFENSNFKTSLIGDEKNYIISTSSWPDTFEKIITTFSNDSNISKIEENK